MTASFAAPDSRIRDSYHLDTLTPLAKPQTRYKKTGIAAITQGIGRYCGVRIGQGGRAVQFGSSPPRPGQGVPRKRPSNEDYPSIEDHIMEEDGKVVKELSPERHSVQKGKRAETGEEAQLLG